MRHKLIVCYFLARNNLLMPCHFWHQNYDVEIFLLFCFASNALLQRTVLFWCQWQHSCTILFFKQKWVYIWSHIFLREKSSPTLMLYFKHNFKKPQQYFISVVRYRYMTNDLQPFLHAHFEMRQAFD